jgi:hypothetical protein
MRDGASVISDEERSEFADLNAARAEARAGAYDLAMTICAVADRSIPGASRSPMMPAWCWTVSRLP